MKYLKNQPIGDDLFEGQSHKHLAETIATQIKSNNSCKIIGLDGEWGSGKSNIVSMIKEILPKNKYIVNIFDIWGYQNDHLRRSILEHLAYVAKDKLDNKKWETELSNLLAKRKETRTQTIPNLSPMVVASLFSAIITPLVIFVVNLLVENCISLQVLTATIPYIIVFAIAACAQIKAMKKRNEVVTWNNFINDMYMLYDDKIIDKTSYETISEKEPSTKQFREWMSKLSEDLVKNEIELILVFDNMDRLPKSKVQEAWAVIHTLFAEGGYNNIKTIVPFDRKHILNAFKAEGNGEEYFGNDFINKTFYVVFRVSPPILSSWTLFFKDKWKEAFGEDYVLEQSTLQVYDVLTPKQSPRTIISFINEFVSILETNTEPIPQKYIALFICGKDSINKDPLVEILKPSYLNALSYLYSEDKDMQKYISALFYQLPPEKALDVVLTTEIRNALNNNDKEALMKYSTANGFVDMLTTAVNTISNISNAAETLDYVSSISSEQYEDSWIALAALYKKGAYTKYEDCQRIILSHLDKTQNSFAKWLIDSYHHIPSNNLDAENYINAINGWRAGFSGIDTMLSANMFRVEADFFIKLVTLTQDKYLSYSAYCDEEDLDQSLVNMTIETLASLSVIPYIKPYYELHKYNEHIHSIFEKKEWTQSTLGGLITRLIELDEEVDINSYLSDSEITNAFAAETEDSVLWNELLSMRLSRFDNFSSNDSRFSSIFNSGTEEPIIDRIIKSIQHYTNYPTLLTHLYDGGSHADILNRVVSIMARHNKYRINRGSITNVIPMLNSITKAMQIAPSIIIDSISDYTYDKDFVFNNCISWEPELVELFQNTKQCVISNQCLTILSERFNSIDQSTWMNAIKRNDGIISLWVKHHPKRYINLSDAIKARFKELISVENPSWGMAETCVTSLEESGENMNQLFTEIARPLSTSSNNKNKVSFFSRWLLKYVDFSREPDLFHAIYTTDIIDDKNIVNEFTMNMDSILHINLRQDFKEKLNLIKHKYGDEFEALVHKLVD